MWESKNKKKEKDTNRDIREFFKPVVQPTETIQKQGLFNIQVHD